MIDVMKRLAELDAQNPNIVKESTQAVEECGMMGSMSSQPHTPASINMTAASGEELSSMLKDIMTLAGRSMGGEEPVGGADGIAVVDTEPTGDVDVGPEVGVDDHEPSVMRSMLDKLNPGDDEDEPKDEKPVEEYDNSPDVETQGYDSMVPSGNDLHREKRQYPAAQPGDNAMSMEESLMSEWKKFVAEGSDQGVAEGVEDVIKGSEKDVLAKIKELGLGKPRFESGRSDGKIYVFDKNPDYYMVYRNGIFQLSRYTQNQGVAEGSDSDLRDSILNQVLLTIYHGAKKGQDMTDTIADELGDYFDEVDNSNDTELKKIYAYVRNLADEEPDIQASGTLKAIKKLKGANYTPTEPLEVPDDDPMVRDLTGAFSSGMASRGIKAHPDWNKKDGVDEGLDILKLAGLK